MMEFSKTSDFKEECTVSYEDDTPFDYARDRAIKSLRLKRGDKLYFKTSMSRYPLCITLDKDVK